MRELKIKPVDEMSVDELIGQLIMVGIPYDFLDNDYKKFISDYKIGNFIYFSRNYKSTSQIKNLNEDLYDYVTDITGSFPLISIDQEGGMVTRLFNDVTFPASPMTTSASPNEDSPYKTGFIIGKDMLKLGLNLNLAPCLEINKDLVNPIVSVRSYGGNKYLVLEEAGLFVKGVQDSGALSCIKHFPGAGSSFKDSHLVLPIIDEDVDELKDNNMYPFLHLLSSDALMSSHCLFKAFDSFPTTLSHKLLTDYLRIKAGFNGLIISDGMEMKAILDNYGIEEGCILALKAGCDILLLCHRYSEQKLALDAVKKAYKDGIITLDEIKEKVRRINKAKEKVLTGLNKYYHDDEYKIDMKEHKLMEDIVYSSYTNILGTKPYLDKDTLVFTPRAVVATIAEDEFDSRNLTKAFKNNFKVDALEFTSDDVFINMAKEKAKEYKHILIYSYDAYKDNVQLKTINELLNSHRNVHLVSLKGPIDMSYFNNLTNYSCLYEYTPNSIKAVIKQLKENGELLGHLPK